MKNWLPLVKFLSVFSLVFIVSAWGARFVLLHFLKFEENSPYLTLVVLGLAVVIAITLEGLFIHLEDQRINKITRSAAHFLKTQGVKIEARVHPITYIDVEPKYYEEASDPSYALSYRSPQASTWALHKTRSEQGNLPNGWKLIVSAGEISPSIKAVLEAIAADPTWLKNYLELGSDAEKVWAFWGEGYAGLKIAQKVSEVLNQIVEAGER